MQQLLYSTSEHTQYSPPAVLFVIVDSCVYIFKVQLLLQFLRCLQTTNVEITTSPPPRSRSDTEKQTRVQIESLSIWTAFEMLSYSFIISGKS